MGSRSLMCITAMTLFAALVIPVRLTAQEQPASQQDKKEHRYKLVDLGTFGGPVGYLNWPGAQVLRNRGAIAGAADTSTPDPNYPNTSLWLPPDPFIMHAFQWYNGVLTDLGALPGANSSFANWISANGLIAGLSETGVIDPLLGVPEANAVLWKKGEMINLGTLEGGVESFATAVNSLGQVTGNAVNTIPDPFSPFGYQNRAFRWDEEKGMQDLGTLGGPDAAPGPMNEGGQIAGFSYTNSSPNPVTGLPTLDPFLWENGKMLDLGTLGGTSGFPTDLNNRGQVVGQSNLAGDVIFHPFLWTKSRGMQDLGTFGGDTGTTNWINDAGEVVGKADLPGPAPQTHGAFLWKKGVMTDLGRLYSDACSNAVSINSKSQVVGCSSDCTNCLHPFLWEGGGPMIDLNAFVPPGSDVQLTFAVSINDRGEIACFGKPPGAPPRDGDSQAPVFLLVPCDDEHSDEEGCEGENPAGVTQNSPAPAIQQPATATPANPALSDGASGMLDRLRGRRFPGLRTLGPGTGPAN